MLGCVCMLQESLQNYVSLLRIYEHNSDIHMQAKAT